MAEIRFHQTNTTLSWTVDELDFNFSIPAGVPPPHYLPQGTGEYRRQELYHLIWMGHRPLIMKPFPIMEDGYVIDVGTGYGLWAVDAGQLRDNYTFVTSSNFHDAFKTKQPGVMFQSTEASSLPDVPRNIVFINVRDSRLSRHDLATLIPKVSKRLCLGGWFQNLETRFDDWKCNKPQFQQWRNLLRKSTDKLDLPTHSTEEIGKLLHAADFQCITTESSVWTHGMKNVVEYVKLTVLSSLSVLVHGGHELEPIEGLLVAVVKELEDSDCTLELNVSCCLGMKRNRSQKK